MCVIEKVKKQLQALKNSKDGIFDRWCDIKEMTAYLVIDYYQICSHPFFKSLRKNSVELSHQTSQ